MKLRTSPSHVEIETSRMLWWDASPRGHFADQSCQPTANSISSL